MTLKAQLIRGLTTAWLQEGESPPGSPIFLFLHGFPDDAHAWQPQIEYFSKHYQVIAPFSRGVGPSEAGRQSHRFNPESGMMDLLEIMNEVDPTKKRKFVVVAHDIGGLFVWPLSEYLGSRLDKIVLINSLSSHMFARRLMRFSQLRKSWYVFLFQIPKLAEFAVTQFWGLLDRKLPKLYGNVPSAQDSLPAIRHYRGALKNLLSGPFWKRPPRVAAPVLALWGKDDPFLDVISAKELKLAASTFVIRVLDGGHWVHQTDSERVNRFIDSFVRGDSV